MSVSEDPGVVATTTRTLQIIVGVLLLSLVSFLVVILAFVPAPKPPALPAPGAPARPPRWLQAGTWWRPLQG